MFNENEIELIRKALHEYVINQELTYEELDAIDNLNMKLEEVEQECENS